MTNVIAIIPARSGSKSIKNKNLQKINGKSLLERAIKFANSIKQISKTIVTTDSPYYQKLALKYGADCPFLRPKQLSTDTSYDIDVFLHCLNWLKKKENFNSETILDYYIKSSVKDFVNKF